MRLPFLCILLLSAAYATDYLRPCYFTNWAHYRQGDAKYVPENYTTGLCTHIFFAFGTFGSDFKAKAFDEADLPGWSGDGMYNRVNALKKNDPNLKTILSFGGWNFGTALFKQMASSAENRNTFITSALAFIDQWGFDGIDIDWEYPAGDDKANFAALMSELKAAAGSKYFITAAVSADPGKIDAGYDVQSLASSLDFVNVMTYDYQDTSKTSQNSPLFGGWNSGWNSANALDHWNMQGMPKEKLLMGIGTYGHGFTLADPNNFGMGAPASPAPAEPITQQGGFGAYYEVSLKLGEDKFQICPRLAQGAKRFWDDEQKVPYLVKDSLWYGYDDVESISTKMDWIKQNGYAGAFTWCLDMDDFFGACGDKYPLHNAIKNGLGGGGIVTPAPPPTGGPTNNPPTNNPPTENPPTQKPAGGPFSCPGDGFFSDPADCTGYYQCANGTPFHFQCSAGTEWNQKVLTCDWPGNTPCFSKKR